MNASFEIGKTYYGRFICDYDSIHSVKIIKKTAKFVTIETLGEIRRTGIKFYDGSEYITDCSVMIRAEREGTGA